MKIEAIVTGLGKNYKDKIVFSSGGRADNNIWLTIDDKKYCFCPGELIAAIQACTRKIYIPMGE